MTSAQISLAGVEQANAGGTSGQLQLLTSRGAIVARHHAAESGEAAVVLWAFGAGGGLGGPAGGVYTRLISGGGF